MGTSHSTEKDLGNTYLKAPHCMIVARACPEQADPETRFLIIRPEEKEVMTKEPGPFQEWKRTSYILLG